MPSRPHPRSGGPLSRRQFLARAGMATAGVVAWRTFGFSRGARAVDLFPNPLRFPTELTDADLRLRIAAADVSILPGAPTRMWTFGAPGLDGEFPGPTIRRQAGEATTLTVEHRLDEAPESLTIHLHGGHTAARFDGQPEREVIPFGGEFTYHYDLMEDGEPERGALQWYHDHSHFRTGRNVWHGLAGMFIIDDPATEAALGLPVGDRDLPLMITDRQFGRDNQLIEPFLADADRPLVGPGSPPFADSIGNVAMVNGTVTPHLVVQPEAYRFRILNAGHFRPYNLSIPGVGPVLQVGTEAGLLPAPVLRDSVLLGPAERAEIVVDFSTHAGRSLLLQSRPLTNPRHIPASAPGVFDLVELRVDSAPSPVPATVAPSLRPLPAWTADVSHHVDRVWAFGLGADDQGRAAWTINGRTFDHSRVDARPELGSIETWMLVNTSPTGTSHYIHIHDVDWLVLSRNGAAPDAGEEGLKETFRLDPGEVVVIASKFTDHVGTFMIHCHMLDHEDHGMMTTFEVVAPGRGDLAPLPGVTPSIVGTRVASLPIDVDVSRVEPEARPEVTAVLEAQALRPGLPATTRADSGARPAASLWCDLGLDRR